ncbi:hypothetical protein [Paraburkholderia unamae]|uniref:hypothetical protein n=1 Tax=Paraburkholderia unamae TaxID=219649 RepID=UPI001CC36DCC|nr:hypothetical protein [Paraburkholderia unamae]
MQRARARRDVPRAGRANRHGQRLRRQSGKAAAAHDAFGAALRRTMTAGAAQHSRIACANHPASVEMIVAGFAGPRIERAMRRIRARIAHAAKKKGGT